MSGWIAPAAPVVSRSQAKTPSRDYSQALEWQADPDRKQDVTGRNAAGVLQ